MTGTLRPLPTTGAVTGILEALGFFRDPDFASRRFHEYGDVFETTLIGQRLVFIRGEQAIRDLFDQSDAVQGWWPKSVQTLLGSRSLANRNGAAHKARRRVVGQLFAAAALRRLAHEPVLAQRERAGLRLPPQPDVLLRGALFAKSASRRRAAQAVACVLPRAACRN